MNSRHKLRKQATFVSLFCGCGGFDLGFIQEGYCCVGAFDIDTHAVNTHRFNLGSPAVICDLSKTLLPTSMITGVDALLAGSPCQGFSVAGKRELHDPRNDLLLVAGKFAAKTQPRVFVAENVAGVTAGEHKRYWDRLHHILRTAGYRTLDVLCDATRLGLPQIRKRMLMVAWNTKKDMNIDLPTRKEGTLRSALAGVDGKPNHNKKLIPARSDLRLIAMRIKPGQKVSNVRAGPRAVHTWNIPEVFGVTSFGERQLLEVLMRLRRQRRIRDWGDADPVPAGVLAREMKRPVLGELAALERKGFVRKVRGNYDLAHTFNGKFRRLEWDRPSLTVDTRFGNPRYFLHPEQHRGFTVREAARLQGFPDSFVFLGPEAAQYRMVGNAVPPPVARTLAKFIWEAFLS